MVEKRGTVVMQAVGELETTTVLAERGRGKKQAKVARDNAVTAER
jgi:hypothetical protein